MEDPQEPRSLPEILLHYLQGERQLGRIDAGADLDAATSLIVGAVHGQVLPRVLFAPPGSPARHPARPGGAAGRDSPARPGAPDPLTGWPERDRRAYLNATALKNV